MFSEKLGSDLDFLQKQKLECGINSFTQMLKNTQSTKERKKKIKLCGAGMMKS